MESDNKDPGTKGGRMDGFQATSLFFDFSRFCVLGQVKKKHAAAIHFPI
jgi:hypothetical protein